MNPTRRDLSKLAAAAVLAGSAGPAAAFWRAEMPEDWAARLERDLNAGVGSADTRFRVLRFTHEEGAGSTMSAVVELHWPPGLRRRPVRATGEDADRAYEALLAEALRVFGATGVA